MLKSALRVVLAILAWSVICAVPAPAGLRGSHGSHGGGGGHSHVGGPHGGGGGHFHGGGSSRSGGSHSFFGSHHGGGGSAGHSMNFSRGGASRKGMFGSSRESFGRSGSRGGSSARFNSRNYASSGGGRSFLGAGRSQGTWGKASLGSRGSSARNSLSGHSFSSRNSFPSRNFSSFSSGPNNRAANNSWNSAARFSGSNGSLRGDVRRNGSFDSNRPPFAQSRMPNQLFRGNSSGANREASGRAAVSGYNRSFGSRESRAFASSRPAFGASSARSGFGGENNARHVSFSSNRPPNLNRSGLASLGGRSGNAWSYASNFGSNATRASFGGPGIGGRRSGNGHFNSNRFDGGSFRAASMSRSGAKGSFGSGRFAGSRNFEFGSNRLGHSGYGNGRFGGHGYGYNHYGHFGYSHFGYGHYGYGGLGWHGGWGDDPFADLWFLGDLFGLALDITRLAIMPAWGFVGADLLGTGLQALSSLGDDSNSYGGYGDSSYGYYSNDSYPSYNAGYFVDQPYYATRAGFLATPCGNYYSDENPGCRQQFQ
jgi:hypothetical protein